MDVDSNKKTSHKLFEADFAVIQLDFPKVAQILSSINKDELELIRLFIIFITTIKFPTITKNRKKLQ